MRLLSFTILSIFTIFSCQTKEEGRYKSLKINSGKFEIIGSNTGEKAKPGEYIIYSVLFQDNNNKVFLDKREKEHYLREQVIKDTVFLKDITPVSEVLYKLSKGDSAIVFVPLKEEQKVDDMKNSDTLFFQLKVMDIVDEEGMRDIIQDEFLKQEAEYTETRYKQIEVDQTIMRTWDEYNKGMLKNKLKHTKSGIDFVIIKEGVGLNAKNGDRVKIGFYGMTKKDANVFENTFGIGKDLEIRIGGDDVMKGWNEAMTKMNKGMSAVFFIPNKLAFGAKGKNPNIPPYSDLVFYIELHEIIK